MTAPFQAQNLANVAHGQSFRRHRLRRVGRPTVPVDVRALIRTMPQANPPRGAPQIHRELSGIET
jgi:hypothetical protein